MPELPDLQVFSTNLQKLFGRKKLHKIVLHKKGGKTPEAALKKHFEKQRLIKIFREGKQLYFRFENNNVLAVHLMLKGQLKAFDKKNSHKFSVAEMLFDDGAGLAVTDIMGKATLTINPPLPTSPDAMSKEVKLSFLKAKLSNSNAVIKRFLMDQKIIRGIGNAYADEILWQARISPFSVANKIPEEKVRELAKKLKAVLQKAEKEIIKSNPGIIGGEIRDFLQIHNAKKKHSPTGGEIRIGEVDKRKTYYTDEQEEFV